MTENDEERKCRGTKADGSPCGAPPRLVGEDGYCDAHSPDRGSETMAERGRRGGYVSTSPRRAGGMDLPPLVDLDAAQTWAEEVARAVADDRISASRGNTLNRVLKTWVRTYAEGESIEAERRAKTAVERGVFGPTAGGDGSGGDTD